MKQLQQNSVAGATTLLVVLGCLNGLMPFATDLYLPAFSQMAESLNASVGYITLTMSSFFAGSCIGQLINGPILDKYGRKVPMMIGLGLFCITSLWCGLVKHLEVLIVLRFLQAIGISICSIGGKAVVRDIYPAHETARIFSILGVIMGFAPIIAPTLGSWLLLGLGWRSIFFFLAIFSFLVIFLLWQFLPKTRGMDKQYAFTVRNVTRKYWHLLGNKPYLAYSIVTALGSAVLFSWISSSSFVFIELLGLTEGQFGLVFASTATCLLLSNQANIFLLRKFKSQDIALVAVILQLVVCAFLFYVVAYHFNVAYLLTGMCLLMLFLHLITTNTMALGLNSVEDDLGVATALMGSLRMALSAVVTVILSYYLMDSALPMVVVISIISLLSLGLQFYSKFSLTSPTTAAVQ